MSFLVVVADLCFGLQMPLIIGLMMSEFVLIDQFLMWGVRYGFLFEIDRRH